MSHLTLIEVNKSLLLSKPDNLRNSRRGLKA